MSTYAHKSLDYFGSLPLVMPPSSLVSKAFLSIPDIVPIALENNIQEETPTIEEETPTIEEETPTITDIKEIVEEKEVLDSKVEEKPTTAPRAIVEEQKSLPGVGVEAEFRMIVQKLLGEGYDSNAIMEIIEFQDISDRATAAGVNTWELFLKLAT